MNKIFILYNENDFQWVEKNLLGTFDKHLIPYLINNQDFRQDLPELINVKRSLEQCDRLITILSPEFVENEWKKYETLINQFADKHNDELSIINLFIAKCKPPRRLLHYKYYDLIGGKNFERDFKSMVSLLKKQIMKGNSSSNKKDNIFIKNFVKPSDCFCGRERELSFIDQCVQTDYINVLNIFGNTGSGKSVLVKKWLDQMIVKGDDYFEKIFAWSFYGNSQYEDKSASLELFMNTALEWFNETEVIPKNSWDRGKLLAKLIRQSKTLLILDGIDAYLFDDPKLEGIIKGRAFYALLKTLAQNNPGLCIVTSRNVLKGFDNSLFHNIEKYNLDKINLNGGTEILNHFGIRGDRERFIEVINSFQSNAMALTLLSGYLSTFEEGELSSTYKISKIPGYSGASINISRVIKAIDQSLLEKPEQNLMHNFCLFDEPFSVDIVFNELVPKPVEVGFNDQIYDLAPEGLKELLVSLKDLNFISETDDGLIYIHPEIRDFYFQKINHELPDETIKTLLKLHKYFKNQAENRFPESFSEMAPLIDSVKFGCKAGKYADVYSNVYLKKITQRNRYFILHKLQAYGAFISLVSNFYEKPWERVSIQLKESYRSSLLGATSYALKYLGRYREAAQTMQAGLDAQIKIEDWKDAAINAESISELYLSLGEVNTAVDYAHMSLDFADLSEDIFHRWSKRCTYANALFINGKIEDAARQFRKAEDILKEQNKNYQLYGLAGFNYCSLLLHQNKYDDVINRSKNVLEWMGADYWQLGKALDWLSIARALIQKSEAESIENYDEIFVFLEKSSDALKEPGYEDYYPLVLLSIANVYRKQQKFDEAHKVLAEAMTVIEKKDMLLHLADYEIEITKLFFEEGKNENSRQHFVLAKDLVEKTSYFIRYNQLKELKAMLLM